MMKRIFIFRRDLFFFFFGANEVHEFKPFGHATLRLQVDLFVLIPSTVQRKQRNQMTASRSSVSCHSVSPLTQALIATPRHCLFR